MPIDVRWGSASHQGRVRDHNEDAVLAGPDVFAVADGMGGHAAGEVASALTVAALAAVEDLAGAADPVAHLVAVLERANAEIRRRAERDPSRAGMGATVAGLALAADARVVVFHLGDSRVYRLRHGQLRRLTEDHSVVGELVRHGELTEEEAGRHPHRNVVTRALGVAEAIDPVVVALPVEPGDCFLVASDGLTDEVDADQIRALLHRPDPVEHRARALLDAALRGGGRDNVSVVVVAIAGRHRDDGLDVDTSPSPPRSAQRLITAVPPSTLAPTAPDAPRSSRSEPAP